MTGDARHPARFSRNPEEESFIMFSGIGATGFLLLAVIALLLFGPNKLPELGRAFGRTLKEFKAGARDLMEDDNQQQPARRDAASRIEVDGEVEPVRADSKRLPE
ncbi:Sec-independent protein translocase protein TatA [Paenibacillus sp. P22]|nr:Sec-independent protein translocase protein TatA [Paenibacillus sp. P22]